MEKKEIKNNKAKYEPILKELRNNVTIKEVMKKLWNLKTIDLALYIAIILLVTTSITLFLVWIYFSDGWLILYIACGIIGGTFLLVIINIIVSIYFKKIKTKKIFPKLLDLDWLSLYKNVLENCFENRGIEITKLEIFSFEHKSNDESEELQNKIHCTYKKADLIFRIDSNITDYKNFDKFLLIIAIIARSNSRFLSNETEVNSFLKVTRSDLVFKDKITLKRNNALINKKNKNQTESITFDSKFTVRSKNELEVKKIFSPQTIEYFEDLDTLQNLSKMLFDKSGIEISSLNILSSSRTEEIANIKPKYKFEKFIEGIAKKIESDLKGLIKHLKFAEPFL